MLLAGLTTSTTQTDSHRSCHHRDSIRVCLFSFARAPFARNPAATVQIKTSEMRILGLADSSSTTHSTLVERVLCLRWLELLDSRTLIRQVSISTALGVLVLGVAAAVAPNLKDPQAMSRVPKKLPWSGRLHCALRGSPLESRRADRAADAADGPRSRIRIDGECSALPTPPNVPVVTVRIPREQRAREAEYEPRSRADPRPPRPF